MKSIWKTMLLLMFTSTSFAQVNLVPNPSFEDTVMCPDNASQIDRAVGWSSYRITPDYYNVCDVNPFFGVPANYYGGYQFPATGNAYAGFCSYGSNSFFREILGTQLTQPLAAGHRYFASMKASRGDGYNNVYCAGNDKLGIRFTMQPYNFLTNQIPIINVAQVYTDSIIMDTLNWVTISGCFTADSNYQYVSFGNFFDDQNTSVNSTNNCTNPVVGAYYYLDDVMVTEDTSLCPVSTSIFQHQKPWAKIYPNPCKDFFWIESSFNERINFAITDQLGAVISQMNFQNKEQRIETKNLAPGIYYLSINTNNFSLKYKLIKLNN